MSIQRTTKESTRFLLIADCYQPNFGGYLYKGDVITVPKGTPIQSVWTEVDEEGNPVPGGHVARRVSRHIVRPRGDEEKSMPEIAVAGEKELAEEGAEPELPPEEPEAAPTPPAAAGKPSARAAAGKKPAAAGKPSKRS